VTEKPAVREAVRRISGYALPEPVPIRVKLDFNESPFDVPEEIRARVLEALAARRWSRYPDLGAPRLKAALARAFGRSPEEVVVGNGSGEVIAAAITVTAGCGGRLALTPPTFSLYAQIAALAGAEVVPVGLLGEEFAFDADGLLAAARGGAVPLVCSPNNPTGGTAARDLLEALADAAPVLLVDQAYVDFASPEDDALDLVGRGNVAVFRTLSKAWAAAGFRIGCAFAAPPLAREIEKGVLPFSVGLAAEELAVATLERPDLACRTVNAITAAREPLAEGLRRLGARVAPSRANFLFFAPPGDAHALWERLRERGVLVRDATAAAPGRLRVTVGSPEENSVFLSTLEELL
jgi:histidinol-phosphate aminotransferase